MQLSERGQKIVALLREKQHAGIELAEALGVSRRTISREISAINQELQAVDAGYIVSDPKYRLQVTSIDRLRTLLEEGISDEINVLLTVLCQPDSSILSIANQTFLSRRAVQSALTNINIEYDGVIRLEPHVGQGVEVSLLAASAADILASIAADNALAAKRLEALCDWDRAYALVDEAMVSYQTEMEPFLSTRQVRLQTIAAMAAAPFEAKKCDNWAVARARAARDLYKKKHDQLFLLLTKRAQIVREIDDLLCAYGIRPTRSDLSALIFDHVVRCSLFPTLVPSEMKLQMHDMRIRHPFEFDFADELSRALHSYHRNLLVEPDFLALYVLASLDDQPALPVSVLLFCHRRSMSTINKRFIEQAVDNADVYLICDDEPSDASILMREWDMVVRDEESRVFLNGIAIDMSFCGVLSPDELNTIRNMALVTSHRKNITRMLAEDNFFVLPEEEAGTSYLDVLNVALEELVRLRRITPDEAGLVWGREQEGERLNISGIAFPHVITPVESSTFRLFAIKPEAQVMDGEDPVELIIVVLASQWQTDKSSIFSYLSSVIQGARAKGIAIPSDYEGVVKLLSGRALR